MTDLASGIEATLEDATLHPPAHQYNCYETFDVKVKGALVGMIQCKGPCYGLTASFGHKHGPWIAFIGPDPYHARNLEGLHEDKSAAIRAIVGTLTT